MIDQALALTVALVAFAMGFATHYIITKMRGDYEGQEYREQVQAESDLLHSEGESGKSGEGMEKTVPHVQETFRQEDSKWRGVLLDLWLSRTKKAVSVPKKGNVGRTGSKEVLQGNDRNVQKMQQYYE